MKTLFGFICIISFFVLMNTISWGQTTLYTQSFGTGGGSLPTGWTATAGTNTWAISTASASSGYTGATGGNNVVATNHANLATLSLTFNNSLSTVGYSSITVIWGARRTSTFTNPVTFEWSSNGSTWNSVSYTEVANTGTWALINSGTRLTLPVGAEGVSNLQFRWTWTQLNNSGTYRIDDFNVQGTVSGPTITLNTIGFNGAFGYIKVGNSSTSSSFTVSGTSLTNDITVTPPTGFEIRTGANPFATSPITLTQSGGSVPTTTIDARFTPLAYVKYSGNIACSSTGAGTQNASVSGTGGIKSVASGNWSSGSIWDGGVVPTSSENVYINASFPVIVDDGTAQCNSIEFDPIGTTGLLVMGSSGSVLSVYGDFILGNSTQNIFSSWPSGAKIKFAGSAPVQTLSGWNTGSTMSTSFMEMQIDKSAGKLTTTATNEKINLGTSLEVISGTFEIAPSDDINGRDITGTATTPTITVQSGGIFSVLAGATQIQSGTTAGTQIGKLTIYGQAIITTTSTNKINFGNIDIESGGTLTLETGGSANVFNPGTVTVKNGGTLENTTTTNLWFTGSIVTLNNGGIFKTTSTTTPLPPTLNNNGTFRYARPSSFSGDQTVIDMDYYRLEISFTNAGTKKIWTLGGNRTIADSLETNNSGILQFAGTGTVSLNGTLRLTSGSIDNITNPTAVLALGNGTTISRATGTIGTAPNFNTSVNLRYTSSIANVTSGPELPTATTVLNNLEISGSQGMTLGTNATVNGNLLLTNGLLTLGSNILTLGSSSTIIGTPSATNMVVATGSGELRKEFSGVGSFTYPVGDNTGTTEYSPVLLDFTSGSFSSAYAGVKLVNSQHPTPLLPPTDYISRYWTVSQSGISSFSCDTKFKYVDADVVGVESNLYTLKYDNPNWVPFGLANTATNELSATVASFSDFWAANEGAGPVELTSFSASVKNGVVQLSWKTATETNSLKFDVERKSANTEWMQIGEVAAMGNSNSPKDYSFVDKNVAAGKCQYRIKMIDADGSNEYSNVVETEIELPKKYAISQNYPNPFNPTTKIDYQLPFDSKVMIEIYGITGEKIVTLINDKLAAGYYTAEIDASRLNLASGAYIYRITATNQNSATQTFTQIKKFVLAK